MYSSIVGISLSAYWIGINGKTIFTFLNKETKDRFISQFAGLCTTISSNQND